MDQADAFAFLEQAAQRVTHGGNQPATLSQGITQGLNQGRNSPAIRGRAARPKPKTAKELANEEAAAFLEQAAQRVTTSTLPTSRPPVAPQKLGAVSQPRQSNVAPRSKPLDDILNISKPDDVHKGSFSPFHSQEAQRVHPVKRTNGNYSSLAGYPQRSADGLPRLDTPAPPRKFNTPQELDKQEKVWFKEAMSRLLDLETRNNATAKSSTGSNDTKELNQASRAFMPRVSTYQNPPHSFSAHSSKPPIRRTATMSRQEQSLRSGPATASSAGTSGRARESMDEFMGVMRRSSFNTEQNRNSASTSTPRKLGSTRAFSTCMAIRRGGLPASDDAGGALSSEQVSARFLVSPLEVRLAKQRETKKRADGESRLRLAQNPWAQLLASAMRKCKVSGVRLPNKLLTGWSLIRNPGDNQVYLMPVDLADMQQLESLSQSNNPKMTATQDRKHVVRPQKIYMRPSANIISKLSEDLLMTPKGRNPEKSGLVTRPGSVNRLLTKRMKEQAGRYKISSQEGNEDPAFITESELRGIQWHPGTLQTVQNLMRLRISKALESFITRSEAGAGSLNKAIYLPSTDLKGATVALDIDPSAIRQAVLLWLGPDPAETHDGAAGEETTSRPIGQLDPSTSGQFILELRAAPSSKNLHSDSGETSVSHKVVAHWRQHSDPPDSHDNLLNTKPTQKAYHPPTITLDLHALKPGPTATPEVEESESIWPTSFKIPVFDLPSLLGPPHLHKTLAKPAIKEALGQLSGDPDSAPHGWLLVTSEGRIEDTEEQYKSLVQEIWQLWLFRGGKAYEGAEGSG